MAKQSFQLYDTTLRDGTQMEGLALTVDDKLAVARTLDALGVGFIEGGWPGAIPRDTEFFRRARTELDLRTALLAAFGATRRPGVSVSRDPQVRALLEAETPVVTLVAKSHPGHVDRALRTTLAENLAMIRSTVQHLVCAGRRVFLDAEHYFDGYLVNREYALEVVRTAVEAGAETVVLCDTNGGSLPEEVRAVVADTIAMTGAAVGIHCHDDSGCAVANTMAAVDAGAVHAQGTVHGYGERCGNANLLTVIANLVLKRGREVIPLERLADLARTGRAVADATRIPGAQAAPYVGSAAFTHKAGLHASALRVDPGLYQHIDPELVGNSMRVLVSDMGGRSSVELKARELGYDISAGSPEAARTAERVKELESRGYSFESADASFELLLREELSGRPRRAPFDVESWQVELDGTSGGARATVRLRVEDVPLTAKGTGREPVHALDAALHAALDPFFPEATRLRLVRQQVREVGAGCGGTDRGEAAPAAGGAGEPGTAQESSTVRALLSFDDGERRWGTVGVDAHAAAAALRALLDAVHYVLSGGPAQGPGQDTQNLVAAPAG